MLEISLSKVIKNYGFNNILNEFNLDINTNERIALIGSNGSGKTTLLNIINGTENIQSGQVSIRANSSIGMLSQIPSKMDENYLVKDLLLDHFKEVFEIEKKIKELEKNMSIKTGKELDKILKSYSFYQSRFESLNGYAVESQISKVCNVFKINNDMQNQIYNSLSGGEKTIINLAVLLLKSPSILLLDEPTNHLDMDMIEWLEDFLNSYKGTVLIVSHDRYFLDATTTKTVLVDSGKSEIFHGNYSYYLIENEKRTLREFEQYKNQQKQIEAMEKAIKRLQEWGKQADNPIFFRRAANIQKRLDKMNKIDKPEEKKKIPISFSVDKRSGNEVLIIKELNLKIENKELINNGNLIINYGDKVSLLGKNGTGKTTLIREILKNNNNSIKIGSSVNIGYIPQEIRFVNESETIIEYARKNFVGDLTDLRRELTKYLFYGDNIYKRVGSLSGGEKVRLMLFSLIENNINFLILDEPTNHIDIETREVLENSLINYKGTLLFISHDRYFINKIAEKIYEINNKQIVYYGGNYNYFKEKKVK